MHLTDMLPLVIMLPVVGWYLYTIIDPDRGFRARHRAGQEPDALGAESVRLPRRRRFPRPRLAARPQDGISIESARATPRRARFPSDRRTRCGTGGSTASEGR